MGRIFTLNQARLWARFRLTAAKLLSWGGGPRTVVQMDVTGSPLLVRSCHLFPTTPVLQSLNQRDLDVDLGVAHAARGLQTSPSNCWVWEDRGR